MPCLSIHHCPVGEDPGHHPCLPSRQPLGADCLVPPVFRSALASECRVQHGLSLLPSSASETCLSLLVATGAAFAYKNDISVTTMFLFPASLWENLSLSSVLYRKEKVARFYCLSRGQLSLYCLPIVLCPGPKLGISALNVAQPLHAAWPRPSVSTCLHLFPRNSVVRDSQNRWFYAFSQQQVCVPHA